ncbi:MAG: hypothetical protein ACYTFY_23605, partial [Planctomycetota bacterium]
MKMWKLIIALLCVSLISLSVFGAEDAAEAEEEIYYFENAEEKNPLQKWVKNKRIEQKIYDISLSEEYAVSGKKSIKLDIELNGSGHSYFKIPVQIKIEEGKKYYASGYMRVEKMTPGDRTDVGLGVGLQCFWGGDDKRKLQCFWGGDDKRKDATTAEVFDSVKKPTKDWKFIKSREIGENFWEKTYVTGKRTDNLNIINFFVSILGQHKNHRITLYLDDLKISSKSTDTKVKVEKKDYPVVWKVFPFGLYGNFGGVRLLKEAPMEAAWRTMPVWKKNYINAAAGGTQIFADSEEGRLDKFYKELEIAEANNIYTSPMTYLG